MKIIADEVKPGARQSSLACPGPDGMWHAELKSLPIDGRANRELIALVARAFGCRKSAVSIKSGQSGRIKQVKIALDR